MSPPTYTLLSHAMSTGSMDLLRIAVSEGESLEEFEEQRKSSVIVDLIRLCTEKTLEQPSISELLELGANANMPGWFGLAPLPYVLVRGNMDTQTLTLNVVSLLCGGADVDKKVPMEITGMSWRPHHKGCLSYPLSLAIQTGSLSAAEAILLGGAHPDGPRGADVLSPLSVAALWKEFSITKLLLKKGANANLRNEDGTTALHHCWDEENAQLLLKEGANLSVADNKGRVPMHEWVERATSASTLEWVALHAPQDRFAQDALGRTPFQVLKERVNLDDANREWLLPILSKWEADLIGQSTTACSLGEVQGRRL